MPQKRSIKDLIGGLVDKDGLKTEVTITLTNQTMIKVIVALLLSGVAIIVIANFVKNFVPNQQLTAIKAELQTIKSHLKT
ncbi:hypothetical protein U8527_07265 [Kordia algicida OT-1]|uniref:Uncharacterized protein n=1 Tax=Kordia algicida OT-1 TaxID=391587 RepID=A9E9J9_9FLAO|nr:hypothetical protein [Kordia algicida]EDP94679.1 hypothetical protein KAOT1_00345 [Kordia algicida OT-1]EDP94744.1 hypothetical protein KAOT1_00670 [Kordia algicida OT-1]